MRFDTMGDGLLAPLDCWADFLALTIDRDPIPVEIGPDRYPYALAALLDYWETATEALIRAGIEPRRARKLAWQGIVKRLKGEIGEKNADP